MSKSLILLDRKVMWDLSSDERGECEALLAEENKLVSGSMLAEESIDDPALIAKVGFTPSCLQPWLDAIINHLIGVQVLHKHVIASDIPAETRRKATELGWQTTNIRPNLNTEHCYAGG